MPKQRRSESRKEAAKSRGMEGLEKVGSESGRQGRAGKKQLQRLKPAEDERKLQTKRFVEQSEWKSKDGNHRLMIVEKRR